MFLMLLSLVAITSVVATRSSFFLGVATSAYQVEGYNPGISIWDVYTREHFLHNVENATDHFHRFREDIKNMYDLGFRNYRFSISWTLIMPRKMRIVDPAGVRFYHEMIDECLRWNITPYITLYHWDLPQYIDDDYNGWLNRDIVDLFLQYSQVVFREYAGKVHHWITINEPLTTSIQGYGIGCNFAPGKCSSPRNFYLSVRYQLLAHAEVACYYKQNYGDGDIAIVLNSNWVESLNAGKAREQSMLAMDRMLGIFLEPILYGRYPASLENETMPFTENEQEKLRSSFTYLAINHYTSFYVDENGTTSINSEWPHAKSSWLYDAPFGIQKLMYYLRDHYHVSNEVPIIITECGFSQRNDGIVDLERTHYLLGYLAAVQECREEGGMTNIEGFFVWSFLDNFEWASGYNETFGIVYVDRRNNSYARQNKLSANVLKNINQQLGSHS
jgi:beta-glucosidase